MFQEVRLTALINEADGQATRYFLMDGDKAQDVVRALQQFRQTGQPMECEIAYKNSGDEAGMSGLAGSTVLPLASVADIRIGPDPLGP